MHSTTTSVPPPAAHHQRPKCTPRRAAGPNTTGQPPAEVMPTLNFTEDDRRTLAGLQSNPEVNPHTDGGGYTLEDITGIKVVTGILATAIIKSLVGVACSPLIRWAARTMVRQRRDPGRLHQVAEIILLTSDNLHLIPSNHTLYAGQAGIAIIPKITLDAEVHRQQQEEDGEEDWDRDTPSKDETRMGPSKIKKEKHENKSGTSHGAHRGEWDESSSDNDEDRCASPTTSTPRHQFAPPLYYYTPKKC